MVNGIKQLLAKRARRKRLQGIYLQVKAYTMVPENVFIDNLELAELYGRGPGCMVECGVWKGGMSAALAKLFGNDHEYFLFDSFEGLPPAKEIDGEKAIAWQQDKNSEFYFDNCRAGEEFAQEIMQRSGVKNYKLVKGFFSETLPGFRPPQPIRILRLDGDWYDSTMQCLENLYPHVAQNGLIIIDDYYLWEGCTRAVHDFLSANKLAHPIRQFNDGNVHYIVKK
jgi:O-methyltransferase